MLFKLLNLDSNLALTLGYLNPALNSPALVCGILCVFENCFGASLYVHFRHPYIYISFRLANLRFAVITTESLPFFSYEYK